MNARQELVEYILLTRWMKNTCSNGVTVMLDRRMFNAHVAILQCLRVNAAINQEKKSNVTTEISKVISGNKSTAVLSNEEIINGLKQVALTDKPVKDKLKLKTTK